MQVDTSLLHHRVCGVARQSALIDGKGAASDRAVPDFMVTLALPLELAASRFQGLYNLTVEALTHLVRVRSDHAELRLNADIDDVAGVLSLIQQMGIVVEQFWRNGKNALQQSIEALCFGNKAGDVVAGGNPHARLIVPLGNDEKLLHVLAP